MSKTENGLLSAYRIKAPTGPIFLSEGSVTQGLIGAGATDHEALSWAAELHFMAIDPCVLCSVETGHA